MNDKQNIITKLKTFFVFHCAESLETHSVEFTSFDKEVLYALDKLFDAHRDVVVPPECASLGFVLQSGIDRSKINNCKTVPCYCGKMPYQDDPAVLCPITYEQCVNSPMQMAKDLADDKRETSDDIS